MEKGELILEDRLYTETDEWVKKVGEKRYQIGITDYAQHQLKDIVAVELPKAGQKFNQAQECGVIESQKAIASLYLPFKGTITAVNDAASLGEVYPENIEDHPTQIRYGGDLYNLSKKPYETWLIEIETDDESQLEKLLKPDDYKKEIEKYKKSDKA